MARTGRNKVFIAASLDGYIADAKGSVDFLDTYPAAQGDDMGYGAFMANVDAILMGRKSFETVLGFGIEWPYQKPVFVWSRTIRSIPEELGSRVKLVNGTVYEILEGINKEGYFDLYIDGGQVIQSFLMEDLISEMTITTVPMLLGSGIPLFGNLDHQIRFNCLKSQRFANGMVQNFFLRMES